MARNHVALVIEQRRPGHGGSPVDTVPRVDLDALCEAGGFTVAPEERGDDERLLATVRAVLGQAAFATAWATGRALPIEHVVADALGRAGASS